MRATGAATYKDPSLMLDVVCTHAAGCDLVIAAGCDLSMAPAPGEPFGVTVENEIGTAMVQALLDIHQRARREFPRSPEAQGLLTVMGYQEFRTMPRELPVRTLCPPQSQEVARWACKLTLWYALRSAAADHPRWGGGAPFSVRCHAAFPWEFSLSAVKGRHHWFIKHSPAAQSRMSVDWPGAGVWSEAPFRANSLHH